MFTLIHHFRNMKRKVKLKKVGQYICYYVLFQCSVYIILAVAALLLYNKEYEYDDTYRSFRQTYLHVEDARGSPLRIKPTHFQIVCWFYVTITAVWLLITVLLLKELKDSKFNSKVIPYFWIFFTIFISVLDFIIFILFLLDYFTLISYFKDQEETIVDAESVNSTTEISTVTETTTKKSFLSYLFPLTMNYFGSVLEGLAEFFKPLDYLIRKIISFFNGTWRYMSGKSVCTSPPFTLGQQHDLVNLLRNPKEWLYNCFEVLIPRLLAPLRWVIETGSSTIFETANTQLGNFWDNINFLNIDINAIISFIANFFGFSQSSIVYRNRITKNQISSQALINRTSKFDAILDHAGNDVNKTIMAINFFIDSKYKTKVIEDVSVNLLNILTKPEHPKEKLPVINRSLQVLYNFITERTTIFEVSTEIIQKLINDLPKDLKTLIIGDFNDKVLGSLLIHMFTTLNNLIISLPKFEEPLTKFKKLLHNLPKILQECTTKNITNNKLYEKIAPQIIHIFIANNQIIASLHIPVDSLNKLVAQLPKNITHMIVEKKLKPIINPLQNSINVMKFALNETEKTNAHIINILSKKKIGKRQSYVGKISNPDETEEIDMDPDLIIWLFKLNQVETAVVIMLVVTGRAGILWAINIVLAVTLIRLCNKVEVK